LTLTTIAASPLRRRDRQLPDARVAGADDRQMKFS
jgi:hypothetical protein